MGDYSSSSTDYHTSQDTVIERPSDEELGEETLLNSSATDEGTVSSEQNEDKDRKPNTQLQSNMATIPKLKAADFKTLNERYNQFQVVKIQAPKLEHSLDSYRVWSQDFAAALRYYKIWSVVNREWEDEVKQDPDWIELNETILDNMKKTVSEYYYQMIRSDRSAAEAWKKLKDHFEGTPLVQAIRLMKKVSEMIVQKSDSVEETIVSFKNVLVDMKEQFGTVHENLLIATLVAVLPDSCAAMVKRVMSSDAKTTMTVDKVITMIMDDQQLNREQEQHGQRLKSTLNAMKPYKSGYQPKNNRPKYKIICFYCQKEGHAMAACEQRIDDEKNGRLTSKIVVEKGRLSKHEKFDENKSVETGDHPETAEKQRPKKKRFASILTANGRDGLNPKKSYIDTGAVDPVTNRLDGCVTLDKTKNDPLYAANDSAMRVEGVGSFCYEGSNDNVITISNMIYSPDAKATFISWGHFDDLGYSMSAKAGKIYIMAEDGDIVMTGTKVENGLYEVDLVPYYEGGRTLCAVGRFGKKNEELEQDPKTLKWHRRLNHSNLFDLKKIENGLKIVVDTSIPLKCLICKLAKFTRFEFPRQKIKTTEPLQVVHSDLSGIIRLPNFDGVRYFVVFIDDYTRYMVVFFLARKYQVLDAFKEYRAHMKTQTGHDVRCLKSDNGTEYLNDSFNDYLAEWGISRQLSCPHSPQSNGVAERSMRTIKEGARCNLLQANLCTRFWPQSVAFTVDVKNCLPNASIGGRVPIVQMFGEDVRYDRIQQFGCVVLVIDLHPPNDFAERGRPGLFVEFPKQHSGYRVYLLKEKTVKVFREVHFLSEFEEKQFVEKYRDQYPVLRDRSLLDHLLYSNDESTQDRYCDDPSNYLLTENDDFDPNEVVRRRSTGESASDAVQQTGEQNQQTEQEGNDPSNSAIEGEVTSRVSNCKNFASIDFSAEADCPTGRYLISKENITVIRQRFGGLNFKFIGPHRSATSTNPVCQYEITQGPSVNLIRAPRSYKEAISSPESVRWKQAMDNEVASHTEKKSMTPVRRPPGVQVLPVMWLYTAKTNRHGEIEQYKARSVVLGNKQIKFEDEKNNAPVVMVLSLRLILAIIVLLGMHMFHIDVKTAFLHAKLNEDVYIHALPGYPLPPGFVYKLNKALYGLRSSAKNWYNEIVRVFEDYGLYQLYSDECVFSNKTSDIDKLLIVMVHVDDSCIASRDLKQIERFIDHLKKFFELTEKGPVKDFLGYTIDYDRKNGLMRLYQENYINETLERFGMENCNRVKTPIGTGVEIMIEHTEQLPFEMIQEYQEIVGSLNYLANATRPDILYVVSVLCRYLAKPATVHIETAKRVLRYLKGTKKSYIEYKQEGDRRVIVYSDADHANCAVSSRSISGISTVLNGCLIGWYSYKQTRVAPTNCESEVLATLDGTTEAEFVSKLIKELCLDGQLVLPITLYNDNKGANLTVQNGGRYRINKAIKTQINTVRRAVDQGVVVMKHEVGIRMVSDLFTKQLPFKKVQDLLDIVGAKLIQD